MCLALEEQGVEVEVHHHEVARAGPVRDRHQVQHAGEARRLAADPQVHGAATSRARTARPRPSCRSPIVGDNGSGMHVHQSVWKGGQNLFAGDGYAGLSDFALYYIGGIIKHAKALNAITNPGTNSYKRLVPGFEAPINLAYSARNRSAVVPHPVRVEPEGPPRRSALPGSDGESVPRVRRDADGGPRRRAEQDPSRRSDRQEPLRPASRKKPRRCRIRARRSTRRSRTSTRTASSSRAAACSPTT